MKTAKQLDAEIARALARRLNVIERETWDDGTVITWLASPFPFTRKPVVPSSMIRTAKIASVPLSKLEGSQRRVTQTGLDKHANGYSADDMPLVFRGASGRLYIADGHHRLAAAYVSGRDSAKVRLVDIGEHG